MSALFAISSASFGRITVLKNNTVPCLRGWSGGAMVLGKYPVPGVLLIWIRVGQGPTALAVGTGGSCLDIFLSSIISLFFLPLFGRWCSID